MLNRKISNYLFYFSLIVIVGIVFLIRSVTIGNIDEEIDVLKRSNVLLQTQITYIEETVEDNNDKQIDHLYELYTQVPNNLSIIELSYYTTAQLELVGITEESSMLRSVSINPNVTFPPDTIFNNLEEYFNVVEVKVYFTTIDSETISDFIDLLYNSDQVFIINNIEFTTPDEENLIGINIDFLAFYDKEDES